MAGGGARDGDAGFQPKLHGRRRPATGGADDGARRPGGGLTTAAARRWLSRRPGTRLARSPPSWPCPARSPLGEVSPTLARRTCLASRPRVRRGPARLRPRARYPGRPRPAAPEGPVTSRGSGPTTSTAWIATEAATRTAATARRPGRRSSRRPRIALPPAPPPRAEGAKSRLNRYPNWTQPWLKCIRLTTAIAAVATNAPTTRRSRSCPSAGMASSQAGLASTKLIPLLRHEPGAAGRAPGRTGDSGSQGGRSVGRPVSMIPRILGDVAEILEGHRGPVAEIRVGADLVPVESLVEPDEERTRRRQVVGKEPEDRDGHADRCARSPPPPPASPDEQQEREPERHGQPARRGEPEQESFGGQLVAVEPSQGGSPGRRFPRPPAARRRASARAWPSSASPTAKRLASPTATTWATRWSRATPRLPERRARPHE